MESLKNVFKDRNRIRPTLHNNENHEISNKICLKKVGSLSNTSSKTYFKKFSPTNHSVFINYLN